MSNVYQRAENELGKLEIKYDENAESPRDWDCNLGEMICWHGRYRLGDTHKYDYIEDFMKYLLEETYGDSDRADRKMDEIYDHLQSDRDRYTTILSIAEKKFVILPLYLYDHSGITMSTSSFSCPWDSGQVGWIYVFYEKIRKEYNVKRVSAKLRKQITEYLVGEVQTYDQYLTGDVYGYELTDSEGNDVESSWGYYGHNMVANGIIENIPSGYSSLINLLEVV